MNVIAIIPARMGSSRFYGKPLADILGVPMIGHCMFRTQMCKDVSSTWVATCDKEIFDYIVSVGGNAVMTSDKHERASDRTAEAMLEIESKLAQKTDIVVMVQGDEPMLHPDMISEALEPFNSEPDVKVVNLMAPITEPSELQDPNEVKVVVDLMGNAIYFSREDIPSGKKISYEPVVNKQICIIPFARDYLLRFNSLDETPLEQIESVDMMRVIENGDKVRMVPTEFATWSVDTPEDLKKVAKKMVSDKLMPRYPASNG